jgi:signal transduction histidine kinase
VRGGFSIENYDFNDPNLSPEKRRLKTWVERGKETGQFGRSLTKDILDTSKGGSKLAKVNAFMGYLMHHTERMNRQVSMIAAYNLELDRLNKKGAKLEDGSLADTLSAKDKEVYAANQSIYATEMTNGGTAAASAPRIAQGDAELVFRSRIARSITLAKVRYRLALDLHIIDNGPGIPAELKDKIFYPLVSGRDGGSGLGLTLAQTFIQQHLGVIECESRPGYTDFRILIALP